MSNVLRDSLNTIITINLATQTLHSAAAVGACSTHLDFSGLAAIKIIIHLLLNTGHYRKNCLKVILFL